MRCTRTGEKARSFGPAAFVAEDTASALCFPDYFRVQDTACALCFYCLFCFHCLRG